MLTTFTANRIRKSSAKIVPFYSHLFKIQFVCKLGFESYVGFGSNQQSQFPLKKPTPWSNPWIPNYLNPAYLETIQFAFLGVAMFLHIIYVPLHRLIIIAKAQ
jgi:hypothetical protein